MSDNRGNSGIGVESELADIGTAGDRPMEDFRSVDSFQSAAESNFLNSFEPQKSSASIFDTVIGNSGSDQNEPHMELGVESVDDIGMVDCMNEIPAPEDRSFAENEQNFRTPEKCDQVTLQEGEATDSQNMQTEMNKAAASLDENQEANQDASAELLGIAEREIQRKCILVPASEKSTTQTNFPLGSSQNPIRIIQQGNKYTSVQQLTSEQLSQIMQVQMIHLYIVCLKHYSQYCKVTRLQ